VFEYRLHSQAGANFTVLLGGFGATTPVTVAAQIAAANKHGLAAVPSICGGSCANLTGAWGFQIADEPVTQIFPHDWHCRWMPQFLRAAKIPSGSSAVTFHCLSAALPKKHQLTLCLLNSQLNNETKLFKPITHHRPSADQFASLASLVADAKAVGNMAFVNLLPNYASPVQLKVRLSCRYCTLCGAFMIVADIHTAILPF
jgi:hypothetical protein